MLHLCCLVQYCVGLLQCVALVVPCSVLQKAFKCVAECCSVLWYGSVVSSGELWRGMVLVWRRVDV